ncbi:hypothetical protein [Caballeronia sp. J97]|uniref:hypothetical protein n=1 Tax=Caballeronia sp. J97 TaxID=2805429 RepID=UPI002AAF21D5|nr:hypothetical protein [Caballeronia sp. J97]
MSPRLLALTNAPLERGGAAEPAIDERAQHGEDRDPRDPSCGEAVEFVAEPCAAEHRGSEHQHDESERRAMLVLDVSPAAGSHARLVAAERIGADRVIHFAIRTVIDLCFTNLHSWTDQQYQTFPNNTRDVPRLTLVKRRDRAL